MIHYFWWIPSVIVLYFLMGYFSVRSNVDGGKWMIFLAMIQLIPFWVVVSRVSKNLLFDALLYDSLLAISCIVAIGIFSNTFMNFNWYNIIGIILVIVGLIFVKL